MQTLTRPLRVTLMEGRAHLDHAIALYDPAHRPLATRFGQDVARVIRVEADVKRSMATPKTVDEALAELESRVGKEGRRKFEKFLREVGELDDEAIRSGLKLAQLKNGIRVRDNA